MQESLQTTNNQMEKEIFEKLKFCNEGDKLLLFFDIKLNSEDLIANCVISNIQ